jgi:hypothetical protein
MPTTQEPQPEVTSQPETAAPPEARPPVDLQALAEKLCALLKAELRLERERSGRR